MSGVRSTRRLETMTLEKKIILASVGSVALCTAVALWVQSMVVRTQGIDLTRNTMRAAVIAAESMRTSMARLREQNAFDAARLMTEARAASDLRGTALYGTVPVVSAWNSISDVARREGFQFRVPKLRARNPKNEPTAEETAILQALEKTGAEEYFLADRAANRIIYARPIRLTPDCLGCHGDPANSPTHDGKDALGFPMEGWKAGEIHGAFVLEAHLDQVDKVASAKAQSEALKTTLIWMLPTAMLIAAAFLWFSKRAVIRPLGLVIDAVGTASRETSGASSQIASAAQSLAQSATEQASSLSMIGDSLADITRQTQAAAQAALQVRELGDSTNAAAARGAEEMKRMESAMHEIEAAGRNVSRIVKTIDEIAFQTNLLALNAAVEAARAGQSGAGFAVVANEVRNLAQRSAEAARETTSFVSESLERTRNGVEICNQVSARLKKIENHGSALNAAIASIAEQASEQNTSIRQVTGSLTELGATTNGMAAHAEESASASVELSAQSDELRHTISHLSELVGVSHQGELGG